MSADGDNINSNDDAANLIGDEYLCGEQVDAAFTAIVGPNLVCVYTGCNKIILIEVPEDQNELTNYVPQQNRYLVTAAANNRLDRWPRHVRQ